MVAYKVVPVYLGIDELEEVNKLTGIYALRECNWCDLSVFEKYPELTKHIHHADYKGLRNGKIDFIAFRLDC